jgi:hypothetical protein
MTLLCSIPDFIPFAEEHMSLAEWLVQEHLPRNLYPKENPGGTCHVQLNNELFSTQVG